MKKLGYATNHKQERLTCLFGMMLLLFVVKNNRSQGNDWKNIVRGVEDVLVSMGYSRATVAKMIDCL